MTWLLPGSCFLPTVEDSKIQQISVSHLILSNLPFYILIPHSSSISLRPAASNSSPGSTWPPGITHALLKKLIVSALLVNKTLLSISVKTTQTAALYARLGSN